MEKFPVPTNVDDVRRFVAFCNYYRKFVPKFAGIAKPLNDLLKKNVKFEWSDKCQKAFEELKAHLLSPQILRYPDFSKEFTITTDASNVACGAVLSQNFDGNDLPIAYASKTFNSAESRKHTIYQEMIAIHWAINYFKAYVYGRKFKIKTDHRPLVYLFGMKEPTKKLTQMRLDLEDYNFEIEYIKGRNNVGADALSRIAITSDELKQMSILKVNTRSMTGTKTKEPKSDDLTGAQLSIYETDSPSKTYKLPKIRTTINSFKEITIIITDPKESKEIYAITADGTQTLESVCLRLNDMLQKMKINKLAMSTQNEIFTILPVELFKRIAIKTLKNVEILLHKPRRKIENSEDIQKILHDYHVTPIGGHIGQTRLYKKLRDKYDWKGMKKTVNRFIENCRYCRINKVYKHTKEPNIVTTTPAKPFDVISIDTVGPLPRTNSSNRYCITIQCDLTKYVVIIPVSNKEASTIAKALVEHFILIYGNFLELKSDQGTEYKNEVLNQIGKILKFKQNFATAYHPQTIGALERNHRCLNEYLRSFSNEHHDDWDEWIKFYSFVYNTTTHTDTDYTPFELVFGRKPNLPQDIFKPKIDPVYNLEQYCNELKYKLQKSHLVAKENLIREKQKRLQSSNKYTNSIKLSEGDLVYITNENRKKLDPHYIGPFKVKNVQAQNCKLQELNSRKLIIVHKNRIIKM